MKEYKIGDKVWYVSQAHGLAVRCTIKVIDDFGNKDPKSRRLFYDFDEYIGHGVPRDGGEIFDKMKDAKEAVLASGKRFPRVLRKPVRNIDLNTWREQTTGFIISTWKNSGFSEKEYKNWIKSFKKDFAKLKNKIHLIEWFNYDDVKGGKI